LCDGAAEVVIYTYKGTNQSIKLLKAYDVFGELEIFDPTYKTNSVIAKEDCTIIKLHRDYIFEWMKIDPNFSKYLLELIANFYIESCSQSARLTTLTIKQRLLLSIYTHYKKGDLSMLSKEILLQEIRAPKRSLNRSLKEIIDNGFVQYNNKQFSIVDIDKLVAQASRLQ
jgi:CRP-like cAMP-binding protein